MVWTLGAVALAYTPTAPEILLKMTATLRRADPVEVRVIRESPDGDIFEELLLTVPGKAGTGEDLETALDLPYVSITLPAEELSEILPSVASDDAEVALGRFNGEVCYILEGKYEKIWVSKVGLLPLRIEVLSEKRLGTDYLYLDMIKLSDKVYYPSRTEVWRAGELILVERMLPATATSISP